MPSNFLNADSSFPWSAAKSGEEKFQAIESYLYMLLEQLRYTLANLESGNFSDSGLNELGNIITKPITLRIEGDEERISELQITAEGLATRVANAEGDIAELSQTADSLTSRVADAEGNISTLQQTASGLSTRVTDAEGNISTLQQTASGLSTRVTNAEGSISTLQQTASGLETRVSSNEGNISTLTQTASGLSSRLSTAEGNISTVTQTANGIKAQITDSKGKFTVLNLKSDGLHIGSASGTTTIDGSNITAGTIGADRIKTSELIVGTNIAMGPNAVISWNNVNSKPTFATVATSGKYSDLTGRPSIPSLPSYIHSTYIDETIIYSPTIYADEFVCYPQTRKTDEYTGGFSLYGYYGNTTKNMLKVAYSQGIGPEVWFTSGVDAYVYWDTPVFFYDHVSFDDYAEFDYITLAYSKSYGPLSRRPSTGSAGQIYFATS